jgi:hypothetical protein
MNMPHPSFTPVQTPGSRGWLLRGDSSRVPYLIRSQALRSKASSRPSPSPKHALEWCHGLEEIGGAERGSSGGAGTTTCYIGYATGFRDEKSLLGRCAHRDARPDQRRHKVKRRG